MPRYFVHIALLFFIICAVFVPNMGRGFIHDDFVHLNSAAFKSIYDGLFTATTQFFTPIAWLSFRIDWAIWQLDPFYSSIVNLALHLANTALVYFISRYLWKDESAALISAAGFALLLPSSVWAVMWIATRAHLLATFFCLGSFLAVLWWSNSGRRIAMLLTILAAGAAIFSKESGVTVLGILTVTLAYFRFNNKIPNRTHAVLILAAVAFAAVSYMVLRSSSGAADVSFNEADWYSYKTSFTVLLDNIRAYGSRTLGYLSLFWIAAVIGAKVTGRKIEWSNIQVSDLAFLLSLAVISVLPFLLIVGRSGIYSYLPGAFSAILLSMFLARQLNGESLRSAAVLGGVSVVAMAFAIFAFGQSKKWRTMAETSSSLLASMKSQMHAPSSNSSIVIEYAEDDRRFYFPDSLASWGLEPAVQLIYLDPTLKGALRKREGDPAVSQTDEVVFVYSSASGQPVLSPK